MSQLYDGVWRDSPPAAEEIGEDGEFRRIESPLRNWISADPMPNFRQKRAGITCSSPGYAHGRAGSPPIAC